MMHRQPEPLPRLHPNIIAALQQALELALEPDSHGAKIVEYQLKNNKKWGSRDRKLFAQVFYDIIRWRSRIAYACLLDEQKAPHSVIANKLLETWLSLSSPQAPLGLQTRWLKPESSALRYALPAWLYAQLQDSLGDLCDQVCEQLNSTAPLFLRANSLKTTPQALAANLNAQNIPAILCNQPQAPEALLIKQKLNVFTSSLFRAGQFEVQDLGSQQITHFTQVAAGMRVIDACAGSGGKTLALAAIMQNKGSILALDIYQWKLDKLKQRAKRASAGIIRTQVIESSKVIKRQKEQADRLLLDVPCSGTGVLRRKPDSKWKLSFERLDQLCQTQADILERYSHMCKVGGKMVYATCSVLARENEQQVQSFLKAQPNWQLEEQQSLLPLPQSAHGQASDGFYMARLLRLS